MTLNIRKFNGTDQDYQTCNDIYNSCWPELARSVAEAKHNDKTRNPDHYFQKFILEYDGKPVGFGSLMEKWWAKGRGEYTTHLSVMPSAIHFETAANTFYSMIGSNLTARHAKKLTTTLIEDRDNLISYYTSAGYKRTQREPKSALDVANFDFDRFANAEEKINAKGFEIVTLGELKQRFDNWQQLDYELLEPIIQDIPSDTERGEFPFDEFIKEYDKPDFILDGNFYAIEQTTQKWVGMSSLDRCGDDSDTLLVGLTGVKKEYRAQGIATALKVKTIQFAKRYGAKSIETENDENNSMYRLNLMLGFQPKPAIVTYELTL